MRINGMCPVCYLKQIFTPKKRVTKYEAKGTYDNGVALTPPMGWSSWNSFRNHIDEDLILEIAAAMKEKGLLEAGYNYVNLDDNWHSNMRDENGNLQGDLARFPSGIASLVEKVNALGLKLGIYSANGARTCEDLPSSLGNEWRDAYTFANWGIEYFKYDFCYNVPITVQAPLVESLCVSPVGKNEERIYPCTGAVLEGAAKIMTDYKVPEYKYVMKDKANVGKHISGLDKALGKATFNNIFVEEDGDYTLTVTVLKSGRYKKFLMATVNDEDNYYFDIPYQKRWNYTARFQQRVRLKKGLNKIVLTNPVANRADSARLQYIHMGEMLRKASEKVAREKQCEEKPMVYSICEWGVNRPYIWGAEAGNLWRTSGDIQNSWNRILSNYNKAVKRYEYAGAGHWNDPDMLEVGNGKLTDEENRAHFSLWCMICAPLILGNDLRSVDDSVLEIVTNKNLIAINQDSLAKPAKRIKSGKTEILVKPLSGGRTAICFFNRSKSSKNISLSLSALETEEYVSFKRTASKTAVEQWSGEEIKLDKALSAEVPGHGVKVYVM